MNRIALALVLVFVIFSAEQIQSQAGTPTSQKVIKDMVEYNDYTAAMNTTDPTAKGAAMEAFVKRYPQSVVLIEALEQAMNAYQQADNAAKVEEKATAILQIDSNHLQAVAIVCYLERAKATQD